jgi:hypothetical protein
MYPDDLETLVDAELRHLPAPRAPHTLLPRVMAAVEQLRRRPWYTRAWLTWPLAWQVASLAVLALIVAGGAVLVPSARAAVDGVTSGLAPQMMREVADSTHRVDATMNAAWVLWRALLEPLTAYAFALVVLMCLACAALGTALNHVALRMRI